MSLETMGCQSLHESHKFRRTRPADMSSFVDPAAGTIPANIITCSPFSSQPMLNIHTYNITLQNIAHTITQTHHTNPNLPTSVVFLMIHDKLLIACGQHESFIFLTCQLSMVGYWPTMAVTGTHVSILEREPEKRPPRLRKAAGAQSEMCQDQPCNQP